MVKKIMTLTFKDVYTLFLISPFILFLNSWKKFYLRSHFLGIFLFSLFYSYTFIPIPSSDATRFEYRISNLGDYSWDLYVHDLKGMYEEESLYTDAYVYTVQFILSTLTDNIKIYRLFFGFVYFLTFLSLIKLLVSFKTKSITPKKFNWFLLGLIFLIPFSSGLNGVRWPLALMVFLYSSYSYMRTRKIKFIILALTSFFIHFISFYLLLFLVIFILTRRFYNPKIISLLILVSFFFSLAFTSSIKSNTGLLGKGIENRSTGYIENENYKEERENHLKSLNWYIIFDRDSSNYFILFALLVTTNFGLGLQKSQLTSNLQYFALLMFLASFFSGQLLDTISNRFYLSANAGGLLYLYHLYHENSSKKIMQTLKRIYIPIIVLHILIILRADLYTVSPNLLMGNIFTEMYHSYETSIQDMIF